MLFTTHHLAGIPWINTLDNLYIHVTYYYAYEFHCDCRLIRILCTLYQTTTRCISGDFNIFIHDHINQSLKHIFSVILKTRAKISEIYAINWNTRHIFSTETFRYIVMLTAKDFVRFGKGRGGWRKNYYQENRFNHKRCN